MPGILDQDQIFACEGRVEGNIMRDEPITITIKDAWLREVVPWSARPEDRLHSAFVKAKFLCVDSHSLHVPRMRLLFRKYVVSAVDAHGNRSIRD